MKTIIADKIASVAQHLNLKRELRVSADIPCEEGVLVAAEVLNNKATYNTLELTSGRMAQVKRGDIIVGALGHRNALFGYSGHLPETLNAGDTLQLHQEWLTKRESASKPDRGVATGRLSLVNQDAVTVMSHIDTIPVRKKPSGGHD